MSKKYSVIVADPAWSFEDKLRMKGTVGVKRSPDSHYNVMSLEAIEVIPVDKLAAEDAVLALWVPSALISSGLSVMEKWGFKQKQIFTWIKTHKDGTGLAMSMGRTFRNCSENALIGTRGKPKCLDHAIRNVALDPATKHSVKPDTLQLNLMKMFNGPYLELFARRDLDGWVCTGNECPSTLGVDINDWFKKELDKK